jgi:pyruvate formate lyase activating enzyme
MRALIFDIKRDCSEDGPGIRTTVFFQGCPLRCIWCQNPEGQDAGLSPDEHGAGRWYALEELLDRVLIDRPFFVSTGGGVTLSGGEPTCQMRFAGAFLQRLQQAGIDTAMETCGFFHYASFEKLVLPYLNRIYFDLKIMDDAEHRRLTRQSNHPVLVNLVRLRRDADIPVTVRVPLVPGMTATDENLSAIGRFLREHEIYEVTLLPYNPLWQDKAVRLGRAPLTCGFMSAAQLTDCARQINS